jgi:hypothetical protein
MGPGTRIDVPRDDLDTRLPEGLARHDTRILGWLFVAGLGVTTARWWR